MWIEELAHNKKSRPGDRINVCFERCQSAAFSHQLNVAKNEINNIFQRIKRLCCIDHMIRVEDCVSGVSASSE